MVLIPEGGRVSLFSAPLSFLFFLAVPLADFNGKQRFAALTAVFLHAHYVDSGSPRDRHYWNTEYTHS